MSAKHRCQARSSRKHLFNRNLPLNPRGRAGTRSRSQRRTWASRARSCLRLFPARQAYRSNHSHPQSNLKCLCSLSLRRLPQLPALSRPLPSHRHPLRSHPSHQRRRSPRPNRPPRRKRRPSRRTRNPRLLKLHRCQIVDRLSPLLLHHHPRPPARLHHHRLPILRPR